VQYSKQEHQKARQILIETKPLEAVQAQLFHEFAQDGDLSGDIYRKLTLLDEIWKQFTIAVDNVKDL
jgi:hypothetical protein